MRTRMLLASVAVAAAGAIAGGCGGDDDTAEMTVSPISKAEWVAQADAICAEGNARLERRAREHFAGLRPGSPAYERAHAVFVREDALPDLSDQVEQIAALGAPEADEGRIEAILSAVRTGIEESRADTAAFNDPEGSIAEAAGLIGAYGAKVCSAG